MYIQADVSKLNNGSHIWVEVPWGKRKVMAGGTIIRLTEDRRHAIVFFSYMGKSFKRPFEANALKKWHDGRKRLPAPAH